MDLLNYTSVWVWEVLDKVLEEKPDVCKCERCRHDMAAMALNRLKPNYVVSEHGRVYAKTKMLSLQVRVDVLTEVTKAVDHVSKNPHHLD